MDVNYSKKLIDLVEENKKYIVSKDKAASIPIDNPTPNKEEKDMPDIAGNVNTKIVEDLIINYQEDNTKRKAIDPYKFDNEFNNKYITNTQKKQETDLDFIAIPTLDGAKVPTNNADKITNPINTGISIIDGVGDNVTSALQSLANYGSSIANGFSGGETPKGLIDNYALYEAKSDIKKTVDLTTVNAIPYTIDKTIKQFQSGSALNSIISGVIGTVNQVAELVGNFYDAEEVLALATANYNQITTGGKLFEGEGVFGFNMDIGGNRPGIKIKKKGEDGKSYKTEDFGVPEINIASRDEIGCLYVRPFQNKIPVYPFNIPFQTNPKISEDTIQANYASEQFLNRVGEVKSFINTSGQNLSIETSYMVLDDGEADLGATFSKRNNPKLSDWMRKWTPSYIQSIENAYRSLVYSTYYEDINDAGKGEAKVWGLLKPPSVRIIMSSEGKASYVNELYAYPSSKWEYISDSDSFSYNSMVKSVGKYNSTLKRLKADSTLADEYKWNKTFVVTGVQISRDDDALMNKDANGNFIYTGFKVNLTLSEITENYLDCIPDFASYYNSFSGELDAVRKNTIPTNTSYTYTPEAFGEGMVTNADELSGIYNMPDAVSASMTTNNLFNTLDTTPTNTGTNFSLSSAKSSIMEIQ